MHCTVLQVFMIVDLEAGCDFRYLAAKYPLMLDSSTRHTSYNILIHL